MLFNSLSFAVFFPIVFIVYWVLPHKYRWIFLLLASYYFYMSWNVNYAVLILFMTIVSYMTALVIERSHVKMWKRIALAAGILICLSILILFKYFNFLSNTVVDILSLFTIKVNPITVSVLLPVGISFYTFQVLSYMIDIYKDKTEAEHNFGIYAAFISFFPQLVAGPIERTSNLLPQIKSEKQFDYDNAIYGIRLMLWGYFKKIAIADVLAVYVDTVYGSIMSYSGFDLAIAVFFFTIQIYCDFSGYSDIALGTAKMLGINLITNFKSPYFSTSLNEYWSRWHISLSKWFRDYIYIPMGGNRCPKVRHYFNLFVTFLVSGMWHGANWTFAFWGGVHGIAQIMEDSCSVILKRIRKSRIGKAILILIVFAFCNLAWIFFRAESVSDVFYIMAHVFDNISTPSVYLHNTIGLSERELLLILCLIGIVALYDYYSLKEDVLLAINRCNKIIRVLSGYVLIIFIIWGLFNSSGVNQFVYFQF